MMLKLPKGLKKKKKGKKSKRKGEEELFTEEELEKYREGHRRQGESGEVSAKENEEWSKFKHLTSGVDTVLKKTQGDLDRIKSTSFFQRVPAGPKEVEPAERDEPRRPVVEVTEADFPRLLAAKADADSGDKSDCGLSDDESEYDDDQDDIFDTSYVDAVERGEVKLAYVPDSPEEFRDDDIFDTSHVDALIKGQDAKSSKGKKGLDIGVAVEVLTGRIDNVKITTKRSKRQIPGDLLLESTDGEFLSTASSIVVEPLEKSILDLDTDVPITSPIDLSISLHTALLHQKKDESQEVTSPVATEEKNDNDIKEYEIDEFTLLAAESLEVKSTITKLEENNIIVEPVLEESWSAFEADKNKSVFAEGIVEDQLDVIDPYLDDNDPFDTSFADAVIPTNNLKEEAIVLDDDDDDFDPRADEVQFRLNNRRKSSVRIHLTNPLGIRESITSDDIVESEEVHTPRDLLGGSTTDLSRLGESPLDPVDINNEEIDPFDTTIVDKIVAPGKVELKLLEQELIGTVTTASIFRVPSDPDFDPRADEPLRSERRASRPENLTVSKSVVFSVNVDGIEIANQEIKSKPSKPVTPYYTKELSISEDLDEESEITDKVSDTLTRARSEEELASNIVYPINKRRHSEYPSNRNIRNSKPGDLLHDNANDIQVKVLTPTAPSTSQGSAHQEKDPFDTSFATNIEPSKTELKLLAKEFSCDNNTERDDGTEPDLLETSDDIFHVKALTPEPSSACQPAQEAFDPFDTSFASDLNPGRTEIKLLESEFIN